MVGYSYNITWRGDRDCSSLAMHSCTWVRDRHRLNRPGNGLHGQYGCVLVQYCCNCGIRRRRHKVSSWLILSENQTPWYPNPNYHCREAQYLALFPSQPLSNVNIDKVVRTRYMFQVLQTMQLGPEQFHAVHVRGGVLEYNRGDVPHALSPSSQPHFKLESHSYCSIIWESETNSKAFRVFHVEILQLISF